jgi:isopentenyl diphosphate isomerase/L-lactate dehydrogenase-like FMN-dependent dehydrogenase
VRAAAAGGDALDDTVTVILEELRLAMFCVGTARVTDLRTNARLIHRDGRAL